MALYTSYRQTSWQFIQFFILQNNQKFLKIDNLAAIFVKLNWIQWKIDMKTMANKTSIEMN